MPYIVDMGEGEGSKRSLLQHWVLHLAACGGTCTVFEVAKTRKRSSTVIKVKPLDATFRKLILYLPLYRAACRGGANVKSSSRKLVRDSLNVNYSLLTQ